MLQVMKSKQSKDYHAYCLTRAKYNFCTYDRDDDGHINVDEFIECLSSILDADRHGYAAAEVREAAIPLWQQMKRINTEGDNDKLTREEFGQLKKVHVREVVERDGRKKLEFVLPAASGLKWQRIEAPAAPGGVRGGVEEVKAQGGAPGGKDHGQLIKAPSAGRRLENEQLSEALRKKQEFTPEELERFGLGHLSLYDYIQSGATFFRPSLLSGESGAELGEAAGGGMAWRALGEELRQAALKVVEAWVDDENKNTQYGVDDDTALISAGAAKESCLLQKSLACRKISMQTRFLFRK